eukprot:5159909-Ditylum_brightwellii.AAC.1
MEHLKHHQITYFHPVGCQISGIFTNFLSLMRNPIPNLSSVLLSHCSNNVIIKCIIVLIPIIGNTTIAVTGTNSESNTV